MRLLVQEREAGDKIVESIKSRGDQVLAVVTEEFQGGEHGKAAVSENG
jgi:histidinol dehydrogenase